MVTKRIIPKSRVQEAWTNPAARTAGFSIVEHPWFNGIPSLKFGGGPVVTGTPIPLQVKGESLIEFQEPELGSNIARISAKLSDASGESILQIVENEWKVLTGNWDFKCQGNRYIFLDAFQSPSLVLRMEPPHHIAIELLRTSVHGIPIHVTEERMMIGSNTFSGGSMSNCRVGFSIG
jgi:hypothetical protein